MEICIRGCHTVYCDGPHRTPVEPLRHRKEVAAPMLSVRSLAKIARKRLSPRSIDGGRQAAFTAEVLECRGIGGTDKQRHCAVRPTPAAGAHKRLMQKQEDSYPICGILHSGFPVDIYFALGEFLVDFQVDCWWIFPLGKT